MTKTPQTRSRIARLAVALALVASSVGCGGDLGDDFIGAGGERTASLMNGRVSAAHPAVGLLRVAQYICTATLVGSQTVLTAAHCVKPGTMTFEIGGMTYQVTSATPHPQYSKQTTTILNDVAILRLASTPTVLPVAVSSRAPYSGLGATLVGYGVTSTNGYDSGVKRVGQRTISAVTSADIEFVGAANGTPNICSGDSGGPTLAPLGGGGSLVQVGVHSHGKADQCGVSEHDMRVDVHVAWMRSVAGNDLRVDDGTTPTQPPGPPGPPPTPPTGPDSTPPNVTIVSPQTGSNVLNSVTVSVNASDDRGALRMVQLLVNGQHISSKTQPPYNFQTTLPNGDVVLTALALDLAGNQSTRSVTVKVGQPAAPTQPTQPPTQPQPPYTPPTQQPPQQPAQYQPPTGCSVGAGAPADAVLPMIALLLLGLVARRAAQG